jgi:hypothetical protein
MKITDHESKENPRRSSMTNFTMGPALIIMPTMLKFSTKKIPFFV